MNATLISMPIAIANPANLASPTLVLLDLVVTTRSLITLTIRDISKPRMVKLATSNVTRDLTKLNSTKISTLQRDAPKPNPMQVQTQKRMKNSKS